MVDLVGTSKSRLFTLAEAEGRKRWALEFTNKFTGAARAFGYGVFHGGSMVRDIDLVAVPWIDPLPHVSTDLFVVEMCSCLGLAMGNRGTTVHGHKWFALWDRDHPDHQIDLKVILPAAKLADG